MEASDDVEAAQVQRPVQAPGGARDQSGQEVAQAAREYEIHPTLIGRWRKAHFRYAELAFAGNGHGYKVKHGLRRWNVW